MTKKFEGSSLSIREIFSAIAFVFLEISSRELHPNLAFFLTLNIVVQNLNFNKMLLSSIESTT